MSLNQTLQLTTLRFGSLFAYCPYGYNSDATAEEKDSFRLRHEVKSDQIVPHPPSQIPMLTSTWVAEELQRRMNRLPFGSYFQSDTTLIPIPKSGLSLQNELWVPDRLANAMVRAGVGGDVCTALSRTTPVARSSSSPAGARPTALEHFMSMSVANPITHPQRIVLVDDFVTRGATALGAANRILTVYPDAQIKAFAAVRTQSRRIDFRYDSRPAEGTITLMLNGGTHRQP